MTESGTRLFELLPSLRRILIVSQSDPDGDSVGTQLALRRILLHHAGKLGRPTPTIEIVNEVPCPRAYSFLPDSRVIRTPEAVSGATFDAGFVLDCGVDRAGTAAHLFSACPVRVWIDHHRFTRDSDYTLRFVDPDASSTAEVVYEALVEPPPWRTPLDPELAECLYTGIIFDTGLFRHSLTRPKTHEIAARLLATGFDFSAAARHVFYTRSLASRMILARALRAIQRAEGGKLAWTTLRLSDFEAEGATEEDSEDVIGQVTCIEEVQVAILFRDTPDGSTRVSFRSKGLLNVGELAASLDPGGGGHPLAAGCTLKLPLERGIQKTLSEVKTAIRRATESEQAAGRSPH